MFLWSHCKWGWLDHHLFIVHRRVSYLGCGKSRRLPSVLLHDHWRMMKSCMHAGKIISKSFNFVWFGEAHLWGDVIGWLKPFVSATCWMPLKVCWLWDSLCSTRGRRICHPQWKWLLQGTNHLTGSSVRFIPEGIDVRAGLWHFRYAVCHPQSESGCSETGLVGQLGGWGCVSLKNSSAMQSWTCLYFIPLSSHMQSNSCIGPRYR